MLVMLGGECNRSFAHYKYSIASPPGSLHFHPLLFYHPGRGSRIGFLQVPSFRLPAPRASHFFTASYLDFIHSAEEIGEISVC